MKGIADTEAIVARQPILDRAERLQGYELLFRPHRGGRIEGHEDLARMSIETLVNVFAAIGAQAVVGDYVAYVNTPRDVLLSDVPEGLPSSRVVIELLETVEDDESVRARCRELRRLGFRLALDDFVERDPRWPLVELVDLVKVDLLQVPESDLRRLVRRLRKTGVSLLAEKVETRAMFERCSRLGFELFQGFFFARPEEIGAPRVEPVVASIVDVLRSFTMEVGPKELAGAVKPHAEIALRLIRLANSAEHSPAEEILSIEHALSFIGRIQARRWLLIMLFLKGDRRGTRNPLARLAVVRGRALETLVLEVDGLDVDPDGAFLVGMLSLAENMLGLSPRDLSTRLVLDRTLAGALVDRSGPLGGLLSAIALLEAGAFEAAESEARKVGVSLAELSGHLDRADVWASRALNDASG